MIRLVLRLTVAVSALTLCAAASASTFSYTITSPQGAPSFDANLTFTATSLGGGTYDITNVSGSIASADLTDSSFSVPTLACGATDSSEFCEVPNPGNGFTIDYDNLLYPDSGQVFDFDGPAFTVNGITFNLFTDNGTYQWLDTATFTNDSNFSQPLNVTATPEPSSMLLLGTGAALALVLARRKVFVL